MNTTIRGNNLGATVVIALIAVLVLSTTALVYALWSVPTTSHGDGTPAHRAIGADGARGPTITKDPNIERHAEVVQLLGDGSLH